MKLQLIIIMFLSSIFSLAQKAEYEIVSTDMKFYEFNSARDKIYIYTNRKLSIYNINEGKLSTIDTNIYAEAVWLKFPFFLAKTGLVYFVNSNYIFVMKNEKIIKKIPFIYKEYRGGMIDAEYLKKEEQKMKIFNKLIDDFKDNDITILMDDIFILNYKDGHSVAFEHRRLRDTDFKKENKEKILKYVKSIDLDIDTSYISKQTKEGATNYFENKKIVIKEELCKKNLHSD